MSLSRKSAAQLALTLSITHPALFDAFVASLPGSRAALSGFGAFGDDGTDDGSDEGPLTADDIAMPENLREAGDSTYDFSVVPGSALDLESQGMTAFGQPVLGSFADPTTNDLTMADFSTPDLGVVDSNVPDLSGISFAAQSVSPAKSVQAIGAPALGAATSALQTSAGLQALSSITQGYLQAQSQAGISNQQLATQSANITGQIQMANLLNPKLPTTVIVGANGVPQEVLANSPSGTPLVGANGSYIPVSTATGIIGALTSSTMLKPLLLIGGAAVLLMLLFGGSSSGGGYAPEVQRRSRPRFMEID